MNRLPRKQAEPMGDVLKQLLRKTGLGAAFNNQLVFRAWDEVSGAGPCTLKRFFRDGILYVTLDSSVVRGMLEMQKASLRDRINERLRADELFTEEGPFTGFVKEIRLK
ncbi:MAG: DUF721 domain-containing protein [Bacteroidales bacterium]|nr:DUF721 domain-containing protein [Bacteroidales bacterium]